VCCVLCGLLVERMQFCVALLLFCSFSLSFCAEPEIEISKFSSRSGDITILPNKIQDDSFLLLLGSQQTTSEAIAIEETSVADLISSSVGGPIINVGVSRETLGHFSLFNKAKANLFVAVDNVGSEVLSTLKISGEGKTLSIKKVAYPQDAVASLTTMMTGLTPSSHGIVNTVWQTRSGRTSAYGPEGSSKVYNLNDRLVESFEGLPLFISASSNYQMAVALGVNKAHLMSNNLVYYWNEKVSGFDSVYGRNMYGLNISKTQILENLSRYSTVNKIKEHFDLESKVDFMFFAEVEFLNHMVKVIEHDVRLKAVVSDSTPDFFSFSFASLKEMRANAQKFAIALQILDDNLLEINRGLSSFYSNKLACEIAFVAPSAAGKLAQNQELKSQVYSILNKEVQKESFDEYFPMIYLENPAQRETVCNQIRDHIQYQVYCPATMTNFPVVSKLVNVGDNSNNTLPYNPNAAVFQPVLWMSIIMVLFVIAAVYCMCAIDIGADSILYRTISKQHQS